MKVNELSKELNVTNKELISFLKEKGYKVSSHMQTLTDEMIDLTRIHFTDEVENILENPIEEIDDANRVCKNSKIDVPVTKQFSMDDLIPCRSVTPWELIALGNDRKTVYHWSGYGDVDYVKYSDLQSLRRKDLIKTPKVIIEDADLCYQWRRELGDTYKHFLKVEYPEEFFDLSDSKFEDLLKMI